MSTPFSKPEKNRCQGFKSWVLSCQANKCEPFGRLYLSRALKDGPSTFKVENSKRGNRSENVKNPKIFFQSVVLNS
jgi:hypothetical protein